MQAKIYTHILMPLLALSAQAWLPAQAANSNLEATGTVNNGCSFGATTTGTLGVGSNMGSLSTEIAGGQRPSLVLNIVGNASLAQTGTTWTRDGASLTGVTTISKVFNTNIGGNEFILPFQWNSPGAAVTVYWAATGQSNNAFQQAGTYKAQGTFTCY